MQNGFAQVLCDYGSWEAKMRRVALSDISAADHPEYSLMSDHAAHLVRHYDWSSAVQ